jgi:hypothetical protein
MTLAILAERPPLDEENYDTPGSSADSDSYHTSDDFSESRAIGFLSLPPEILDQILTHLTPQSLLALDRTCRKLSHHAHKDTLWASFIRSHVPPEDFPQTASPAPTYRSLYLAHHPYWFLPQHALWFSDDAYTGAIMLIRFDPRRGCIEGYRLLGERGPQWVQPWTYLPNVSIHSFQPRTKLWLDHPLLNLPYTPDLSARSLGTSTFPWDGELRMARGIPSPAGGHSTSVSASFFLSRDILPKWQDPKMALWPPRTIPSVPRARSSQGDAGKFRGASHKPQTYSQISNTSFRTRVWTQFHIDTARFGVRLGEEVATWSTLPKETYTPSPKKPYQGIWVGDYAGHGCEFLLLFHTPTAPPLPPRRESFNDLFGPILGRDVDVDSEDEFDEALNGIADPSPNPNPSPFAVFHGGSSNTQSAHTHINSSASASDAHVHEPELSGALQAIKLTGDINVPRGQHTFIADDLGPGGYIRHAKESPFNGARIVQSRGHVAGRGFVDGEFSVFDAFQLCLREECWWEGVDYWLI